MAAEELRVVLVEPDKDKRTTLCGRLRAQGFSVDATSSPEAAAALALANPPRALIADLWMPSISGVQLCRLLRSEASTAGVPIILRAEGRSPRDRFWAERAGAVSYVPKGKVGELVRALASAIAGAPVEEDAFFTHIEGSNVDIRERIAQRLDAELFDSVLAAEVRALGTCESVERLFDLFSQFFCQLSEYEWLALGTSSDARLRLHCHPGAHKSALAEALAIIPDATAENADLVLDEDAYLPDETRAEILSVPVSFGKQRVGTLAVRPLAETSIDECRDALRIAGRELGGPLRMATLVEDSQRLAHYDPLTGIMNRRAFIQSMEPYFASSIPSHAVGVMLLDVDHFKSINDRFGHTAGDVVLARIGQTIEARISPPNVAARWGGEEFVIAIIDATQAELESWSEEIRTRLENLCIVYADTTTIPITASIGFALAGHRENLDGLIERADRAMYEAKVGGRNQCRLAAEQPTATLAKAS